MGIISPSSFELGLKTGGDPVPEATLATLGALFLFGTFWFWTLVVLAALLIAAEVHYDKGTPATVTLVATVLFLHFFSGINILQYVYQNVGWFFGGAAIYLLVGALYSVVKLSLHTYNMGDRYQREKVEFLKNRQLPKDAEMKSVDTKYREEWENYVEHRLLMDIDRENGCATFNLHKRKATVVMWIGHWPFSLIATLLNDPVRQLINFLYYRMVGFYEKIIEKNLGQTRGDILTHAEQIEIRQARPRR